MHFCSRSGTPSISISVRERENMILDRNFIEHVLWFQDRLGPQATEEKSYLWKDRGYLFRATHKIPYRVDYLYLCGLLSMSQDLFWEPVLKFSRMELYRKCGFADKPSKKRYERMIEALKCWANVSLSYDGCLYRDNKDGSTKHGVGQFGIIDSFDYDKTTKKVTVRLSLEWLEFIRTSNHYMELHVEELARFRSPLAMRLFEVAKKNLHGRKEWCIDIMKLAKKIPIKANFPAHVRPKLETAVKRIRHNTGYPLLLDFEKRGHGKIFCHFSLDSDWMPPQEEDTPPVPPQDRYYPADPQVAPVTSTMPLPFQHPDMPPPLPEPTELPQPPGVESLPETQYDADPADPIVEAEVDPNLSEETSDMTEFCFEEEVTKRRQNLPNLMGLESLIRLVPEEYRYDAELHHLLRVAIDQHGIDIEIVERNIRYVNTKKIERNYRGYLRSAIYDNYAKDGIPSQFVRTGKTKQSRNGKRNSDSDAKQHRQVRSTPLDSPQTPETPTEGIPDELLYDHLSEEERALIDQRIEQKVLKNFQAAYSAYHFRARHFFHNHGIDWQKLSDEEFDAKAFEFCMDEARMMETKSFLQER